MAGQAASLPAMTEVARAAGVSLRSLTDAFRRFRGYTPSAFLRERRLQEVRRLLQAGGSDMTVSRAAYALGYVNLGEFARSYRARFGERPSETLRS